MSKKKRKNQGRAEAPAEENQKVSASEDEEESAASTNGDASGEAEAHASGDEHEAHDAHGAHGDEGHPPAEDDRPRNGLITLLVVATCVVLVLMVIGVKELFTAMVTDEVSSRVLSVQSSQLRELRAAEQQRLTHYQWASQKDGVVRIPTDRAVELTLAAYRNPPPAAPTVEEPKPAPSDAKDVKPEEGKDGKSEGKDEKSPKDEKKDDKKKDEKGKTEPPKEPKQ